MKQTPSMSRHKSDSPYTNVIRRALTTAWWIIKIMIPTSLIVSLLNYYGVIAWLSTFTAPLFSLIGLPGKAAVVYISSLLLPLYVPIAAMGSLTLNLREVSILSLMCLLAHNLPIESAVQKKSGAPLILTVTLRMGFSLLGGFLLNNIIPMETSSESAGIAQSMKTPENLMEMLKNWVWSMTELCIKLLSVIMVLMIIQDYLKRKGLMEKISQPLAPFMRLCGLRAESSFLWLIANIVGLTYGAGIMAQELENSNVDHRELKRLNAHIALNHSLIEDTTIFSMIGVSCLYLIIPRFLFALITVWCMHGIDAIREKTS